MLTLPHLTATRIESISSIRHAFFGRQGGVSVGDFESLNCGLLCGDRPEAIAENRRRVATHLGGTLFTNRQMHGNRVRTIEATSDPNERFEGDGMVTRTAGIALGVLTADCAPVLFADRVARIIGVAHAGWHGALTGVTDAVVEKMVQLGARLKQIICVVGPAIQPASYQVGLDLIKRFQADSPIPCLDCFHHESVGEYFDLPHYLRLRIAQAGVTSIDVFADDTYADEKQFFSYRRSCKHDAKSYGRHISAIMLL